MAAIFSRKNVLTDLFWRLVHSRIQGRIMKPRMSRIPIRNTVISHVVGPIDLSFVELVESQSRDHVTKLPLDKFGPRFSTSENSRLLISIALLPCLW